MILCNYFICFHVSIVCALQGYEGISPVRHLIETLSEIPHELPVDPGHTLPDNIYRVGLWRELMLVKTLYFILSTYLYVFRPVCVLRFTDSVLCFCVLI